ncbi:hypothetical protein HNY73_001870 [Argiope bruennichi]|uniref:Uncharacterized protein n=1 Tax=Argiope bruennichi TaxID=94029 RepID=A0A8T0FT73_ARGBR|nr:hypothetical protein HNY73_001870 [Argiope bruennichi]
MSPLTKNLKQEIDRLLLRIIEECESPYPLAIGPNSKSQWYHETLYRLTEKLNSPYSDSYPLPRRDDLFYMRPKPTPFMSQLIPEMRLSSK